MHAHPSSSSPFVGYTDTEEIGRTSKTLVYRARVQSSSETRVLKVLARNKPTGDELAQFRHEYRLIHGPTLAGVIHAYSLERNAGFWVMSLEDIGGSSLDRLSRHHLPPPRDIWSLLIEVAEILVRLHQNRLIHKDISPGNIVWNRHSGAVQIIDFGIATALSCEQTFAVSPERIEGTLAYISPEQTGRMNRPVDYRSDYYALGASFYHLLTGHRPFTADDSFELIHSHIARAPLPPHEVSERIPVMASRIILKLMAKEAEGRYQSGRSLIGDLRACYDAWNSQTLFDLGVGDRAPQLQVPGKLYGREQEMARIHEAFERTVTGNSQLVFIRGGAGMGKSALVHEMQKPLTEHRGIFAVGKFEQFEHDVSYQPLLNAFGEVIRAILTGADDEVAGWRERLCAVVGDNGRLLTEFIPESEALLGIQPELPELAPAEAHHRLQHVLQELASELARGDRPVVMFFDDLQWADASSLALIETLSVREDQSLLVICAYRDDEVDESHPLIAMLVRLRKLSSPPVELSPAPLDRATVAQMLSDTLQAEPDQVADLAELCARKSEGNPFFLLRFLQYVYEKGLLRFDPSDAIWRWDMVELARAPIANDVIELLVEQIGQLSPSCITVLGWAACLGSPFSLHLLAEAQQQRPAQVGLILEEALDKGFLLPLSMDYKLIAEDIDYAPDVRYCFVHDRVRQAAYEMIDRTARERRQLRIGRLLDARGGDDLLFEVTGHLLAARALITDRDEQLRLAERCERAGCRALTAASAQTARHLFTCAIELFGDA
ncbi:MAG: AAA family ATPase, partial [Myxococcota bacterium]